VKGVNAHGFTLLLNRESGPHSRSDGQAGDQGSWSGSADTSVVSSERASKSTQAYQRERTSITGLRLKLRKIMQTGRLIRVAVSRFVLLFLLGCYIE
jgi:hypothetical protein